MDEPTQKPQTDDARQPGGDPSDAPTGETKAPPQESDPGSGQKSDR